MFSHQQLPLHLVQSAAVPVWIVGNFPDLTGKVYLINDHSQNIHEYLKVSLKLRSPSIFDSFMCNGRINSQIDKSKSNKFLQTNLKLSWGYKK